MTQRVLHVFAPLPLRERLFVRARLALAPLEAMAKHFEGGSALDVGCGHGALSALLLDAHPAAHVVGLDPDPRKIAWAKATVGRMPGAEFEVTSIEVMAASTARRFDRIFVADVLYLLPLAQWPDFLSAAKKLLAPGGFLILKEAENDGSWRAHKTLWQERLMVRLLKRTKGSGAIGFHSAEVMERALNAAGFARPVIKRYQSYTTPHILFMVAAV